MSKNGIIFDIKKYAIHDGPGIRTTVFFKGCSMACQWCHNPESKNNGIEQFSVTDRVKNFMKTKTVGYEITVAELMKIILKDKVFYDESGGGVTFSGGEPLVQSGFLLALLKECKKESIHTAVDTSGEANWNDFQKIINFVDLFLFDLKIINDKLHEKYTGISNQRVHHNLNQLIEKKALFELRIPLIPGITDGEQAIDDFIEFILSLKTKPPVTLLKYNVLNRDKLERFGLPNRLGKLTVQSEKKIEKIRKKFLKNNISANISG